jgi:AcrR family transcriptional regulator
MRKAFEKLSEDRQTRILDAAAEAFARKGYYQANIAEICRKAAISNGALYNYFKNKEALYTAVFTRTSDLIAAAYQYWSQQQGAFFSILEAGLCEVIPFSREHRDYMVVYFEHGHPAMDRFASTLSDLIEKISLDFWTLLLEKGRKDGDINPGIDIQAAAYMLDNHVLMLAFSSISEHYSRRFHRYFGRPEAAYTDTEKVALTMRSFREFLV